MGEKMHIAIIGAAGMIGRKLSETLAETGTLAGKPIDRLTLADVVQPSAPDAFGGQTSVMAIDLAEPAASVKIVSAKPNLIIHLAAIVSGEAEADFEKGYAINLDGTRHLLEATRHEHQKSGYRPRVIFSSSLAVFGAPLPDPIGDEFIRTPLTSYGTQKAIGELLLDDYTRRGFIDGIGLRLPTICIRPGKPNKAASGFFSGILREPLVGQPAILPVQDSVKHWHASPRSAVGFIIHAASLDTGLLGTRRTMTMPGVAATVADQIEALRRAAGDKAVALIRREPDEAIERIIASWPRSFDTKRAHELGFRADADFDEIIKVYIDEELGGKLA